MLLTMLLDRLDRLVGQRLALVAGEIHLDVGGLAVVALRTRAGQRIAPQILDVLDVFGVGIELFDDLVVVRVRLVRRAASGPPARSSTELLDLYSLNTSPTRLVAITDCASSGLIDTDRIFPTTSSCGTTTLSKAISAIQPRMIGTANVRMNRGILARAACLATRDLVRVGVGKACAHADFTMQKVRACTPLEVFSSLTSLSTVMRQPRMSPSLCADDVREHRRRGRAQGQRPWQRRAVQPLGLRTQIQIVHVGAAGPSRRSRT